MTSFLAFSLIKSVTLTGEVMRVPLGLFHLGMGPQWVLNKEGGRWSKISLSERNDILAYVNRIYLQIRGYLMVPDLNLGDLLMFLQHQAI